MSPQKLYDAHGEARFLLQGQAVLTLLFLFLGQVSVHFQAYWIGSGIALLATSYFYVKVFSARGAQQVRQMVRGFYLGQCGKWLLSMVLFFLAFKVARVDALGTLLGYSLAQLLSGFVPFYSAKKRVVNIR